MSEEIISTAKVRRTGNSVMIPLRKDIREYYGIENGDMVSFSIISVKRKNDIYKKEIKFEEEEKLDYDKEPTLPSLD